MCSAFSLCQSGLHFLISKSYRTRQATWAIMPSSATSGSAVRGQHRSNLCLLHLKKLFPIEVVAYKHKRINLFGVKKKKKKKKEVAAYLWGLFVPCLAVLSSGTYKDSKQWRQCVIHFPFRPRLFVVKVTQCLMLSTVSSFSVHRPSGRA